MILAVAAHAEELTDEHGQKAPAPPELSLGLQVDKWGLKAIFGSEEIPASMLKRMSTAMSIYHAFQSYKAGSSNLVEWYKAHPVYAEIVQRVRVMRENHI